MFGLTEICLLLVAAVLLIWGMLPRVRPYRSLFGGGSLLFLITALFPRTGNPIGQFLFDGDATGPHPPRELFGIIWWILSAWLVKSLLDLLLRRTIFPNNDEPHARRLFADLASALIYVLAFFGILDTVFKQQVSALLATSGVLAIVLGLALQNTLGDVFAGLAINIERPLGAGDWITIADQMSGQVIEVNWRATRIRTWANDMVAIPNSLVSKSIVTNHSRPKGPHSCVIRINVDVSIPPTQVIDALLVAANGAADIAQGSTPLAYACEFSDSLVVYELAFAIDSFALARGARSAVLRCVADSFQDLSIPIGAPATTVRIIQNGGVADSRVPV
jgi:small-conductance mechanosensitive channel